MNHDEKKQFSLYDLVEMWRNRCTGIIFFTMACAFLGLFLGLIIPVSYSAKASFKEKGNSSVDSSEAHNEGGLGSLRGPDGPDVRTSNNFRHLELASQ